MDKKTILKAFNDQFEEFMTDIDVLFENNKDIKTSKTALLMLRKANPKMICDVWYRHIYTKYATEINNGNIDYFLNKDYSSDLKKMDGDASSKIMDSIDKIRQPLRELDENKYKKKYSIFKKFE